MTTRTRTKNWCFTYFGIQDLKSGPYDVPNKPKIRDETKIKYLCYQLEICPKTNRPHYQGYFQTTYAVSRPQMYDWLDCPNAHYERANGSPEDNRKYCSKKESGMPNTFEEFGSLTSQGERTDLKAAVNAKSLRDISEANLVRYGRGILFARQILSKKRDFMTEVHIIWGETDSGKSSRLPVKDAYWKDPCDQWWDGYDNEKYVVLDDWKEKTFDREYMLRLCDRYPMSVRIKGGSVNFNSEKIYITSNTDPSKWYGEDPAWIRRITSCTEIKKKSKKEAFMEEDRKIMESEFGKFLINYEKLKNEKNEEGIKLLEKEYEKFKTERRNIYYSKMEELSKEDNKKN